MFLDLQHLSVQYPGRNVPAVADVSFGLRVGDIGVLIGPSGCGKTTLLRAVAERHRMAIVVRAIVDGVEMRESHKSDDEDAEQRRESELHHA